MLKKNVTTVNWEPTFLLVIFSSGFLNIDVNKINNQSTVVYILYSCILFEINRYSYIYVQMILLYCFFFLYTSVCYQYSTDITGFCHIQVSWGLQVTSDPSRNWRTLGMRFPVLRKSHLVHVKAGGFWLSRSLDFTYCRSWNFNFS